MKIAIKLFRNVMVNNPPQDKAENVERPWGEEVMRLVNYVFLY